MPESHGEILIYLLGLGCDPDWVNFETSASAFDVTEAGEPLLWSTGTTGELVSVLLPSSPVILTEPESLC